MTTGPNPELPVELVEAVVLEFWCSENSSKDRITFMKSCPLINNLWKDVFARISSRDIYVPTIEYLVYLSTIIRTNSSLIYCSDLLHCTRTITCHVDLTEVPTTLPWNPTQCFPNIEQMNFEVNYRIRGRWHESILCHQQLIRTRIFITLHQATTRLSVLPVNWHIIAENPEADNIRGVVADVHWDIFLREATLAVAPGTLCCIRKDPFKETVLNSTYAGGLLHFRGQALLFERMGDVQRINYYFRKAAPKPSGLWSLAGEVFEDAKGVATPPGSVNSCWKTILGETSGR
ncbi:hypothetical protein IW261DRAFT_1587831 [Armillaria novae-zelandiae]|uniref:Uncharacterized protein n=1 Tax=Armillaria novae-zelandiae TaxID=153914 RepID=A0AA39PUK3_9AGAR|nr:hypothetical protein IW261DRAFT_1587831 [Armillaria novae-zelandiae]